MDSGSDMHTYVDEKYHFTECTLENVNRRGLRRVCCGERLADAAAQGHSFFVNGWLGILHFGHPSVLSFGPLALG